MLRRSLKNISDVYTDLLEQAEFHFQLNHFFFFLRYFRKILLFSLEDVLAKICDKIDDIAPALRYCCFDINEHINESVTSTFKTLKISLSVIAIGISAFP